SILMETQAIRLILGDRTYTMKQVESALGTKYAEGAVVWSSSGDDGVLEDDSDPGKPQVLAKGCHLQSVYPLNSTQLRSINGTATFGKHPALSADAVLIVQLRDPSRRSDDPAGVFAEEKVQVGGKESPV